MINYKKLLIKVTIPIIYFVFMIPFISAGIGLCFPIFDFVIYPLDIKKDYKIDIAILINCLMIVLSIILGNYAWNKIVFKFHSIKKKSKKSLSDEI